MRTESRTRIILGGLAFVGVVVTAVASNWDKLSGNVTEQEDAAAMIARASAPKVSQSASGNGNLQFVGSNNVIFRGPTGVATRRACRHESHGVETYRRTFAVERSSPWTGGGFDRLRWCNQVIGELRGQHPDGMFEVISTSERSESKCAPFNCPQYLYTCNVRVQTDPLYLEKVSSACI